MSNQNLFPKTSKHTSYQNFLNWASNLKNKPQTLKFLIGLNFVWAIASMIVDLPWLLSVPTFLIVFTPICSIYPLFLCIWYILYYNKRKIPAWFTVFIFIGCASYGILAQLYFPMYMSWPNRGINFHDIASMFWVAVYGLQAFILASELKPIKTYQLLMIIAYFGLKDFSDYHFKTFVDFLQPEYPEWIRSTMLMAGISVQISFLMIYLKTVFKKYKKMLSIAKNF